MIKNFNITWRIYGLNAKGLRDSVLLGTVTAESKTDAESKAAAGHFNMKTLAFDAYKGEFIAHI